MSANATITETGVRVWAKNRQDHQYCERRQYPLMPRPTPGRFLPKVKNKIKCNALKDFGESKSRKLVPHAGNQGGEEIVGGLFVDYVVFVQRSLDVEKGV